MRKLVLVSLLLLFCAALTAHAAEEIPRPPLKAGRVPLPPRGSAPLLPPVPAKADYTTDFLRGLWKADVERTRDLFGDKAADLAAKDPDTRLEFDVPGKVYRAWADAGKTKKVLEIPLQSLQVVNGRVTLRSTGGKTFEMEIIDPGAMILLQRDVVIVRQAPESGR